MELDKNLTYPWFYYVFAVLIDLWHHTGNSMFLFHVRQMNLEGESGLEAL